MSLAAQREVWLRGPLPNFAPIWQPVAHALLQAREEVVALAPTITPDTLWARPAGVASAGFHLQHLTGVLDRLSTYARGEPLGPSQRAALADEGVPEAEVRVPHLVARFGAMVDQVLAQLQATDPATAFDARLVGRAGIPSTVLGLLIHAAEHTMRHVGQLTVTARIVADRATSIAE